MGLVYVAAFTPDAGESLASLGARLPPPPGIANIQPDGYGFLWINPERFRESFCQDLDEEQSLVMALAQKPIAGRCFGDASGAPAWKSKPSWYQISANDRMIPPETEAFMAQRRQPRKTITLQASHASLASQGAAIVSLIEEASTALM
jgi:hypothetical protein